MALRDQPYLPLYVQDFLTDEKLIECSAAAHGVYIRIMCLMHKSATYGKILLRRLPDSLPTILPEDLPRQNERQNKIFADLFAEQLVKQLPFREPEISAALEELLTEGVLKIEDNFLVQKRMVNDNELSIKRSKAGKRGADTTNSKDFADHFAAAKVPANHPANSEYENEYNNRVTVDIGKAEHKESTGTTVEEEKDVDEAFLNNTALVPKMIATFKQHFPKYPIDLNLDPEACLSFAYRIAKEKGWKKESVANGHMEECLNEWRSIVEFVKCDNWYKGKNITYLNKDYQSLIHKMNNNGKPAENKFIAGKTKPVWNTGNRTRTVSTD